MSPPARARVRPRPKPEAPSLLRRVVVAGEGGEPLVAVGRDLSDAEIAHLVRLDVLDVSILLGPRNAIALGRALMDVAGVILASHGTADAAGGVKN